MKDKLHQEFFRTMTSVIWKTKIKRDPENEIWNKGRLPILLIGGGCKEPFFYEIVNELDNWLSSCVENDGVLIISPPFPESLNRQTENQTRKPIEYQYMAVAWGLSHRAIDIGEIIPADRFEDIVPVKPVEFRSRYISKEQV